MALLRIRVSPALKSTVFLAAGVAEINLSHWIRIILNAASGKDKLPRGFKPYKVKRIEEDYPPTSTITIRVTSEELDSYQSAAKSARLSLSMWCSIILSTVTGLSELKIQLTNLELQLYPPTG